MPPPSNPSDPRATVVHTTGDAAAFPDIPGYRVVKKLGQGGMATVYQAVQVALDRPVSIKVMEHGALADETSMQRFENEARTIAKLSHPNIVAIHEIGRTADGRLYYSMPYLPNGDLAQRSLDHDDARIIEVLRTLLSALDYAHQRGIVHRDVKQENVLFDADNRPLLADFGIAMSKHDDVRITTAGFAVGSAAYMAPEQARGDVVDGRADLYSVGVLTYELLTGQLPFRSSDAFALALMHAQKELPRLPPAKKHWQAFVDKAMAKEPAQRFASAKDMIEALDRIGRRSGGSRVSLRLPRGIEHTPDEPSRKAWVFALVSVAAVAAGLYTFRDRIPGISAATSDHPSSSPAASVASPTAMPTTSAESSTSPEDTTPAAPPQPPAVASPPVAESSPPPATSTAGATRMTSTEPLPTRTSVPGPPPEQVNDGQPQAPATHAAQPGPFTADQPSPDAPSPTGAAIDPGFVKLHDRVGIWPPAAIGRTLVTRQQYAAFVAATQRAPAACTAAETSAQPPPAEAGNPGNGRFVAGRPGRRGNRLGWNRQPEPAPQAADEGGSLSWNHPGFPQSGDHPVVCVTWDDANAYAQWMTQRSGHHYRLPSTAEWRLATVNGAGGASASKGTLPAGAGSPSPLGLYGLEGNVSEWLADCGLGCGRRQVAGRSWRGRGNEEITTGRLSNRAFDDVGFRVVEVLDDRGRAGAGR